jgi:hypothetical protein
VIDITSPQHQLHVDGLQDALAMKALTYRPDPAPAMQRTIPYCNCNKRACPLCYRPILAPVQWMTKADLIELYDGEKEPVIEPEPEWLEIPAFLRRQKD